MEFLQLPEEVLTTTMIHHQHYFPVVDEDGKLKPAFLAVTNMQAGEAGDHRAQFRARADGAAARRAVLLGRGPQGDARVADRSAVDDPVPQEARDAIARRPIASPRWRRGLRREAFGQPAAAAHAEQAGRLCKADLATDMVRELTELQGTMGGIYAREEGLPEEVWKAIYFHYLPVGVEADAPPSRQQLGRGRGRRGRRCRSPTSSIRWSACSPPASGRPARAIRWACGVRRRAR